MSDSTHLGMPYLDAAQSQKHVTHNEALSIIDACVHLSVVARNVASPPSSPVEGARYLIGSGATGVFAGKTGQIAAWQDNAWRYLTPRSGWRTYVEGENILTIFDGSVWRDLSLNVTVLQNLTRLGLGTTADASNPLSAKLNSALFTALTAAESGSGDLRFKLNKEAAGQTVSQLYQSGYSGRAETGLMGDDHFRIKVSADGSAWANAIDINPASGVVSFPSGTSGIVGSTPVYQWSGTQLRFQNPDGSWGAWVDLRGAAGAAGAAGSAGASGAAGAAGAGVSFSNKIINGNFLINQRAYVSGATLAAGAYAHDRWKAGSGGCVYTFTQSTPDTTITITSGTLVQSIEDANIEGGAFTLCWMGSALARVGGGSYAASPITLMLTAGVQANIEFGTGTLGQVALAKGSSPTAFERRPIGIELVLCQRYYSRRASSSSNDIITMTSAFNTGQVWGKFFDLPVEMRATPSVSVSNPAHISVWNAVASAVYPISTISLLQASRRSVGVYGSLTASGAPGFTAGQALFLLFNTTAGWIGADAEL